MDLIQYKPEVLANELYEISKAYHESKVILSKYERDRKRYIAQEYLKQKALGKTGKLPVEMSVWMPVLIIFIFSTVGLIHANQK